jgi:hypothetical protein
MNKTFAYHKPSAESLQKIDKLREAFSGLEDMIKELCPKSREMSVAMTYLETSAMWAVKSIVHEAV